jgi:hypothetical protein
MSPTIKLYDALKRMRKLTDLGIPFTLLFYPTMIQMAVLMVSKQVTNAQLRKGYRDDQSKKANLLIGM